MIESLYITLVVIGILLTVYSIIREAKWFFLINLVLWLILMAESYNVQTFYVVHGYNLTHIYNITTGYAQKTELGMSAFSLAFVFINLIFFLVTISPRIKHALLGEWRG